jgi:cytidine deaminase, homotetrameric
MTKRIVSRPFATLEAAERELIDQALAAQKRAYAPYSRFPVGAALQGDDGCVYSGCNVENASYGATVCAERNAVARAVAAGCRTFVVLVVVTPSSPPAPPCGLCRQVVGEFVDDLPIVLVNPLGEVVRTNLSLLLPLRFSSSKVR